MPPNRPSSPKCSTNWRRKSSDSSGAGSQSGVPRRSAGLSSACPASGCSTLTITAMASSRISRRASVPAEAPHSGVTRPNATSISLSRSAPIASGRSRHTATSIRGPASPSVRTRIASAGKNRLPQTLIRSGRPPGRVAATAWSPAASTCRAGSRKCRPAGVSVTPRAPRTKSFTPRPPSSREMRAERACCERERSFAAWPKCRWSAAVTKARTWARSRSMSLTWPDKPSLSDRHRFSVGLRPAGSGWLCATSGDSGCYGPGASLSTSLHYVSGVSPSLFSPRMERAHHVRRVPPDNTPPSCHLSSQGTR